MSRQVHHAPTRFPSVKRIAVLRGGGLGDLVMAMPAINALARAYSSAEITLLGMPSHAAVLRDRNSCIAHVEVLPFVQGVRAEEGEKPPGATGAHAAEGAPAVDNFMTAMQAKHFDLAVQLHGGGRYSNPFVHRLNATHAVGSHASDAVPLERSMPHQYFQHEVLRGLEISALAGAASCNYVTRWDATAREEARADAFLRHHPVGRTLVLMHPGAKDRRRRWPAERFAEVGAALANDNCLVVVLGDSEEASLAKKIVEQGRELLRHGAASGQLVSAAGEVDLGTMCGLLSRAALFVGNDSGPRHVAQALGTPTASIYWAPNVVNAAPLVRERHRVQIAWNTACPVCGAPTAGTVAPDCGHDGSFVSEVSVQAVLADAAELL